MYYACMKIMFGNNDRLELLTLLLSCILEVRYEVLEGHIEVIPNTIPNKELGKKKTERDIVVRIKSDENRKIILEVNIKSNSFDALINRNLFYMNQVYITELKENEDYDKITPTFLINFNTFYTDNIHKKIFDTYYLRNEEGYILTERQKILNINIEKCYQLWYDKVEMEFKSPYERDLFYLCSAMVTKEIDEFTECINMIDTTHSIKEIMEEVSSDMNSKDELRFSFKDFMEEERRINDSIISEVRNSGIKEAKTEMILNMYHDNIELDTIARYVNLETCEVQKIIDSNK